MINKLFKRFKRIKPQPNISLIGYTNELLNISDDNSMKMTRLFDLGETLDEDQEILDVSITSTNPYGGHPKFDSLIGKKIKITVEVLDI